MLVERKKPPVLAESISRESSGLRFLFYSHDGLGLGHMRRNLAVARALTEMAPGASVLLATGTDEVSRLGLTPSIDVIKLPGLRKVGKDQYRPRHLQIPDSEIRSLRSALLLAAVETYRPAVVLVDKHPFGAKGEFRAGLEELRASGGRAVLGLRDILDEPQRVSEEWAAYRMKERIAEVYDLVLVYGELSIFDPVSEYQFPESLAGRTRFCGYVVNRDRDRIAAEACECLRLLEDRTRPAVLATAGGGEDGFLLLDTFLRAAVGAPWKGIAVAGPMIDPEKLEELQRLATEANVSLCSFVPQLSHLFKSLDALVCMGGYNTLVEAISRGVPTVCVPRTLPRREQAMRARAFEQQGLLVALDPEELTVTKLNQAISAALRRPREQLVQRARAALNFDGAQTAARYLLELAMRMSPAEPRIARVSVP